MEEKRYNQALENVGNSAMNVRFSFSVLKLCQSFILSMGSASVIYVACRSPLLSEGEGTVAGQLILVSSLFAQLCAPLEFVGQHFRDCLAAAEDLRELESLRRKSTYTSSHTSLPMGSSAVKKMTAPVVWRQPGGPSSYRKAQSRLRVRDLSFSYSQTANAPEISPSNGDNFVLKNLSFTIEPGGFALGIVGPSGCGKSTLLRLLLGLEPMMPSNSAGCIEIDGFDVTQLDRVHCFSLIGQDTDLFRGLNLEENVRYGSQIDKSTERSVRALENAAEDAQLGPVLERLQGGWAASVGPRGRLLSGGERQRVCLARALYREEMGSSILLMDEATSNLDAQTESLVTKAIMKR